MVCRLATQGHLIAGVWRHSDAGGTYEHRYAATGKPQAVVGLAGERDVNDAVAAARAAQPAWGRLAPARRAAVLFRLADLLEANAPEAAELAALDNGTPVSAMNPGMHAAAWVRYYAGWCDKLDAGEFGGGRGTAVRLEPFGVVAAIPPWNGSMMGMAQKCGPALASGNAVVAKPPEVSPFGMLRFAELALEAGLPEDVLNLVVGGVDAGAALVAHSGVDKVTFTGGTATGRAIMASAALNITPVTLELGGKSPNIVFSDADLDRAAAMAALLGTGLLSGQGCALPTRSYVHDDVYESFWKRSSAQLRHSSSATLSTSARTSGRWSPRRQQIGSWPSSPGLRRTGRRCSPAGADAGASFRRATSWNRPSSVMSTMRVIWPVTRSSVPSTPSCGSTTMTKP